MYRQKSIPLACWYNPQIDNALQLSNNIIFAVITLLNKDGSKLTFCQQMVFQDKGKVNNILSTAYKHVQSIKSSSKSSPRLSVRKKIAYKV